MTSLHYLIYGHGGSYNHGGEAITRSTIELLRTVSPECYITLSTHFPQQDLEFGIMADEFVTRNLEGKTNQEVYQSTLERITSNTTAIQVGGDNYCYANWQRYAQIHQMVKKRGGRSVLWGCSIDPNVVDNELLHVLQGHDLILAREELTFRMLKTLGLDNVLQVSDIAFVMEPERVDFPLEHYIAINLSPLVCRKNPNVIQAMQRLVHFIVDKTDYNIALIPHVVMAADNDMEALSAIGVFDSKRIALVSDKLSAKQYKYIISKAQFCVAARTHVTIAAYSSDVPTLAIGYSVKARGIAADLGMSHYLLDVFDDKIEETLLRRFEELLQSEKDIRQQLRLQMKGYKRNVVPQSVVAFLKGDYV